MCSPVRRRLVAHIVALSFYLSLFPWPGPRGVPEAEAKVSPLQMITRQVKKGNMLMVLDTSGSMTGVPGEQFAGDTELGVDCDLGLDCRQVSQTGQCLTSTRPCGTPGCSGVVKRFCSNDKQCRVGSCASGGDPCLQDFDCPSVGAFCANSGLPCTYDVDCGVQAGTCKTTGVACSSSNPCATAGGKCSDGGAACMNAPGQCPNRFCSDNGTKACAADADCQAAGPVVPTVGLQVHYKYNEASGTTTVTDHSGNGNTATFGGAGAKRATGLAGVVGGPDQAIDCSQQGGFARAEAAGLQLGNTVTISTWFLPTYNVYDQKLVSWGSDYELIFFSDQSLGIILGGVNYATVPGGSIPLNKWTHLAVTWNGTSVSIYINGARVGAPQTVTQTIATKTQALVVCSEKGSTYYRPTYGYLDNTRIYNTALADAEVQAIFTSENTPSTSGLFGHWKLDGDGTDSSGNGATLVFDTPVYVTGQLGQAADRAASTGWLEVPNNGNILGKTTNKLTMAMWFYRPSSPAPAGDEWLMQRGSALQYRMLLSPGGNVFPTISHSGGAAGGASQSGLFDAWHHVAATWDGATGIQKTYIDGSLVDTATGPAGDISGVPGNLFVGSWNAGSGNKFNGKIDDVRLYNSVLTDAEIAALVGVGPDAEPGLVMRLRFDGNGNDNTGMNHNASPVGGASYVAGKYGQAASVSGGSHFEVPAIPGGNLDVDKGPNYTITAWFNQTADSTDTYGDWVVNRQASSWSENYGIGMDSPSQVLRSSFKPYGVSANNGRITNNQWIFAAVTANPSTVTLWNKLGAAAVTGVGGPTARGTQIETDDNVLYIGANRDGSTAGTAPAPNYFTGYIDDVRIYNRELSQSELEAVAAGNKASSAAQPASNLLGQWKFDEGTGVSVADQSTNGNSIQNYCTDSSRLNPNQTGSGCPNGMPPWGPGHSGAASDKSTQYNFYEYGVVPSTVLDGKLTNQFTMSAWVRKDLSSSGRWWIHQQNGPNSSGDFLGLWVNGAGKMEFLLDGNWITDSIGPTLNQWYHMVATYDGANLKLYRDGNLVATAAKTGNITANSQPITFGAARNNNVPDEFADGRISEVSIWNKALTSTEVTALQAGATPPAGGAFCKPNNCVAAPNACISTTSNKCQGGLPNQCLGINTTDTCVIDKTNVGPAKMCRLGQYFCAVDDNCLASGFADDECVPATSRAVVAKRVLRNVMLTNTDIINFGLMGLSQGAPDGSFYDRNKDGVLDAADKDNWRDNYYFPYYRMTQNLGGSVAKERYFTADEMEEYGCYNRKNPSLPTTCTVNGVSYSLTPKGANSRYVVFRGGGFIDVELPYCGEKCPVDTASLGYLNHGPRKTDARGTGIFSGALYEYMVPSGTYDPVTDEPFFSKTYLGPTTTISGENYTYFKPHDDYYSNPSPDNHPPIRGANCLSDMCSTECGGNWDPGLTPMMDTTDTAAASKANVTKMLPMLEKARAGGFMHWGSSPLGCALINDFAQGATPAPNEKKLYSAWNYLEDVRVTDPLACRENFIVLITDGESTGPGDIEDDPNFPGQKRSSCDVMNHPACRVQWDDPAATAVGCPCKSIQNALALRKSIADGGLNVKTYVIGFSPDATMGALGGSADVNENIARAGGTCRAPVNDIVSDPTGAKDRCMFTANNETELQNALQAVIFDAIKGSYSTTPASATSGTQVDDKKLTPGGILFDARVDFPSWRGHLMAYDTNDIEPLSQQPKMLWDAGSPSFFPDPDAPDYAKSKLWINRRVYTSDGAKMIPFQIDQNNGAILNRDALFKLGLGANEDEAERIAKWMLGDPLQGNKAPLGAFVNSTPIEVGPPGLSRMPGGRKFYDDNKTRTSLVYAASDDGMLHAFFTRDTTIGGTPFKGGQEAFAYIPADLFSTMTTLYAQGGQKADPRKHLFGMSSSPKVKNVCWDNCADDATAVWKS
jgi:hypothetical protein